MEITVLWFGMDRTHVYMWAYTLASAEIETLSSVICLLEVNLSAIILCEKQSIQVLPDTARVLQYIQTLQLYLQNLTSENKSQCNHKAAHLLRDIEYTEQTVKAVLDISNDKDGKGSFTYTHKILHIL